MNNSANGYIGGITGLILAGGAARRMGGGDKGLTELAGKPLIEHALARLAPQVDALIINANRNVARYADYGHPVVTDERQGFQGPLAGMASGIKAAETEFMVCAPCDSPLLPEDLVERLFRRLREQDAELSVAHNGERLQPVFTLMRTALASSLLAFLDGGGRKIDQWFQRHQLALADFSDQPAAFSNVNSPEELDAMAGSLHA